MIPVPHVDPGRHASIPETLGIQQAVVPNNIKLLHGNVGRWQTRQIVGHERRNPRINDDFFDPLEDSVVMVSVSYRPCPSRSSVSLGQVALVDVTAVLGMDEHFSINMAVSCKYFSMIIALLTCNIRNEHFNVVKETIEASISLRRLMPTQKKTH